MFVAFLRHAYNVDKHAQLPPELVWQSSMQDSAELTQEQLASGWEILSLDEFGALQKLHEPLAIQFANDTRPFGQPHNFSRQTFDKYKARYFAVGDIIAQICAENEARLLSGAWSYQKLLTLVDSPYFASVFVGLQSLSFPTALSRLNAVPSDILDDEIKKRYADIIKERMV